ncbi:uncharacterized protein TNCV_2585611 [Trichonephila clavipes]|nr:uncharacterized protein TNCV_2585611 [Trichonephila clavipes]
MDEQLKALLEGINALKSGQEETKERMENMQRSQEETKNELKEGMQKGLEDMQKSQEETKNELRNRMEKVEERVAVVEEKIEKKVEQVEERIREQVEEKYEELAGNFRLISQRVEDLENKLLVSGNKNKSKILPSSLVPVSTSPVPVTTSTVSVKLSTYMTEKQTGRCTRFNFLSFLKPIDGLKRSKLAHLQVKTRHQKPEESLQEYAFKMQKLTTLAFSDFSANVREMISFEYFVDGLKDEEIQMAVRMADFKDLKSALLYAPKVEAATQASCIDHHSI